MSVLIPAFNSELSLGPLVDRVVEVVKPHYEALEIVVVNDGSVDETHRVSLDLAHRYPEIVRYVRLARNFSQHNAIMCGLRFVTGDAVAIIDDDFQNPPEEILPLADHLSNGYDVVYGQYETKRHSLPRRLGSRFNDVVATWLLGKPPGLYLSNFKVLSAFMVRVVTQYGGPFPYLDGLILRSTSNLGVRPCRHEPRREGRSNYRLTKLFLLWLSMFTGFSVVPLRVVSVLGLLMAAAGLIAGAFFVFVRLTGGVFLQQTIPPGWASIIVSVVVFAGIQLSVLGMIGEYLGRVFLTQSQSPQFVIREAVGVGADRVPSGDA